jgi:hypothetical protein
MSQPTYIPRERTTKELEEDKQHEKDAEEKYKELSRDLLISIEETIPTWNEFTWRVLDEQMGLKEKDIREFIGDIRWYLSHGYFKKGRPHPDYEDGKSNPPASVVYSLLKGQYSFTMKDIGVMMLPEIASHMESTQAALKVAGRLKYCMMGYMTPEAIKKDQEEAHIRKIVDPLKRKRHAEDMKRRREEESKKNIVYRDPEEYIKMKEKERAKSKKEHEEAKRESLRRFKEETERLKRRDGTKT